MGQVMKDMFSTGYFTCSQCHYVGRFLNEQNINRVQWKRNSTRQWLNHSDYACPKCFKSTTEAEQIDYDDINEIAYNAREGKT